MMTRTMKTATRMKVLVHLLEVRSWLICSKAFLTFECIGGAFFEKFSQSTFRC